FFKNILKKFTRLKKNVFYSTPNQIIFPFKAGAKIEAIFYFTIKSVSFFKVFSPQKANHLNALYLASKLFFTPFIPIYYMHISAVSGIAVTASAEQRL
ncbi:MAG: hypothetical protein K0U54_01295, partial [Bacteroidetes bacterium]|nr:hypothetical protein [Bacteroidota bacterium]